NVANNFYASDATQKQVTYAMLGGSQPAPVAHQSSHVTGTDQIPSASSSTRGLLAQLSGNATDYVGGDNVTHALKVPTVQRFLTGGGSGTYTTPAGVLWLEVVAVGGGGGSAGSG